jgi:hypothetical protein
MPPFGSRKARTPETAPPETAPAPAQQLADAEAALNALLSEQADIQATLRAHQQQRHEWLADGGALERVTSRDREDNRLKLRLEQIAMQLPPRQAAVQQAHVAVHEARWQDYRPVLVEAQQRLAAAISELYSALTQVQDVHTAAQRAGYADRLGGFVRPPPKDPVSDYALREFVKAAGRQQQPVAVSAPMLELAVEAPLRIPPDRQRFTPRRVPVAEIEAISPIAAPRRVHILHGPVRTANLNVGIPRMHPGEQHIINARAAHALVGSGCVEYADEPVTAAA